jgi:hypothetical protein
MERAGHETPAESLTEAQFALTQLGSRQVQESANTHVCQWLTQTTWGKIAQTSLIPCRELVTGASMLLTGYREGNRKEKKNHFLFPNRFFIRAVQTDGALP